MVLLRREGGWSLGDRLVRWLSGLLHWRRLIRAGRRVLYRRVPLLLRLLELLRHRSVILLSYYFCSPAQWNRKFVPLMRLIPINYRLRARISLSLRHPLHFPLHSLLALGNNIVLSLLDR